MKKCLWKITLACWVTERELHMCSTTIIQKMAANPRLLVTGGPDRHINRIRSSSLKAVMTFAWVNGKGHWFQIKSHLLQSQCVITGLAPLTWRRWSCVLSSVTEWNYFPTALINSANTSIFRMTLFFEANWSICENNVSIKLFRTGLSASNVFLRCAVCALRY